MSRIMFGRRQIRTGRSRMDGGGVAKDLGT